MRALTMTQVHQQPLSDSEISEAAKEFLKELSRCGYTTFGEDCLEDARQKAAAFVDDMAKQHKPRWLSFVGRSGTGKTFLATQIFNFVLKSVAKNFKIYGENTVYSGDCIATTADRLAQMWRANKSADSSQFVEADLLLIDDIGTTADRSGFITDAMYSLLSRRLGKWTLITSNLTFAGISEQFDERLADRMIRLGNAVCKMDCKSFSRRRSI